MIRLLQFLVAPLLCSIAAIPAFAKGPDAKRVVLESGAVIVASQQPAVPMVVVQVLIDAGARRDPADLPGLAYLTADLLTEGTRQYSAKELAAAADSIGATIESSAGMDSAFVTLKVLSKHWTAGLALLAEVLTAPSFPVPEVERRREAILAAMKAAEDQPGHIASRAFTEKLFGNEPYGHSADGRPESVRRIRRQQIQEFYAASYKPSAMIVSVAGDLAPDEVVRGFSEVFAKLPQGPVARFEFPPVAPSSPEVVVIPKEIPQTNLVMGHRGIRRSNPDYFAVTVMNFLLGGGGFGSRLLDNIRTRAGLAYSVSSGFTSPQGVGSFRIEMQTKSASARQAVSLACEEIRKFRKDGVTATELEEAKLYLTGSFPLQFDSNGEIAGFLSTVELHGLGASYADEYLAGIAAVTREDVLRAAQTYLRPSELLLVAVGRHESGEFGETVCPEQP